VNNYPIKSVTFGGFDKQDVISYIERTATEAAGVQQELRDEAEQLRKQLAEAEAARDSLREELDKMRREAEVLRAEREDLLADAQAYAQFREKIGAIECQAHKRASELEASTYAQLRQTVDLFRRQYQILMSTFETTAAHVNGELRKVEVNLTQLPRAMDQSGLELNELAAQLEQRKEN